MQQAQDPDSFLRSHIEAGPHYIHSEQYYLLTAQDLA